MAIQRNLPRTHPILQQGYNAYVSLAALQWCAVVAQHIAGGKKDVTVPGGQGVLSEGILQNAPAINTKAEVMHIGISRGKTSEALNGGVELTPSGAAGTLEAAAAGDYVVAISEEAATCAGAIITIRVIPAYQKNA